jgi:hypothetical protein
MAGLFPCVDDLEAVPCACHHIHIDATGSEFGVSKGAAGLIQPRFSFQYFHLFFRIAREIVFANGGDFLYKGRSEGSDAAIYHPPTIHAYIKHTPGSLLRLP